MRIKQLFLSATPTQTEAQYICQVRGCRKLFVEAIQIEAHLKHHRNYIPTNGNFECKCCPESFTRKEQLDQHILANHTYEGLLKSQQKKDLVHLVKHTVHGSHLTQDSAKKTTAGVATPVTTVSKSLGTLVCKLSQPSLSQLLGTCKSYWLPVFHLSTQVPSFGHPL